MATQAKLDYECSKEEWQARLDLAACYRVFDLLGWSESIYNHISLAVPGEEGAFLINPFGLLYEEVTASNLVKIDVEGHEPIVIEQLMKSAHRERVFGIFYELDQRWADAGSVRDSLEQAGFTGFTKFGIGRHYDMLATRNSLSPRRMQQVA